MQVGFEYWFLVLMVVVVSVSDVVLANMAVLDGWIPEFATFCISWSTISMIMLFYGIWSWPRRKNTILFATGMYFVWTSMNLWFCVIVPLFYKLTDDQIALMLVLFALIFIKLAVGALHTFCWRTETSLAS